MKLLYYVFALRWQVNSVASLLHVPTRAVCVVHVTSIVLELKAGRWYPDSHITDTVVPSTNTSLLSSTVE